MTQVHGKVVIHFDNTPSNPKEKAKEIVQNCVKTAYKEYNNTRSFEPVIDEFVEFVNIYTHDVSREKTTDVDFEIAEYIESDKLKNAFIHADATIEVHDLRT